MRTERYLVRGMIGKEGMEEVMLEGVMMRVCRDQNPPDKYNFLDSESRCVNCSWEIVAI